MPGLSAMARLCTLAARLGPAGVDICRAASSLGGGRENFRCADLAATDADRYPRCAGRARVGSFPAHLDHVLRNDPRIFSCDQRLGVPLAVAVTYSRGLSNTIYPLILVTQSVPKVAFAPILLIWLGYGDFPKIIVAFLVAFFPVVVDTATGLRSPRRNFSILPTAFGIAVPSLYEDPFSFSPSAFLLGA